MAQNYERRNLQMRYILFGTGKYCQEYVHCLSEDKIICYIDNDKEKQEKLFRGKKVYSVERGLRENYDLIVVMIKDYEQSVQQLVSMGVSDRKIIKYDEIWAFESIPQNMTTQKGEKTIEEWVSNRTGIKIFICSHEFTRTGVPVALMNLAILLKKTNYQVLIGAMRGGALQQELIENGIDFISDLAYQGLNKNKECMSQMKGFDAIILGTLALAEVADAFSSIGIPVLWWIHETSQIYYSTRLPEDARNIYYYGGGKRVIDKFRASYPREEIEELLYYLPDLKTERSSYKKRRTFAMIGYFGERKAQDILMKAIEELPDKIRESSDFYFVGRASDGDKEKIDKFCKQYENAFYIYELDQEELASFYHEIDVLVCPSRDDPMPIVVTQAMQNGIPCLVSSQVGQSCYIKDMGGGLIFPSEDDKELKECLIKAVSWTREEWEKYARQAREIFDSFFSEEKMRRNLRRIMSKRLTNEMLST